MNKDRIVVIAAVLIGVALSIGLVATTVNSNDIIQNNELEISGLVYENTVLHTTNTELENNLTIANDRITNLTYQVAFQGKRADDLAIQNDLLKSEITELQLQTEELTRQNSLLRSEISELQIQVTDLTRTINMSNASELKTLAFHVCEKGDGYEWGRLPDVNYTYSQILDLNNDMYEVLLLPEYKGNENWTEAYAWIRSNFAEIPIMLSVFEGGNKADNSPVMQLNIDQISEAVATCNVRWLRIAEMISWYLEHPNLTFPDQYIASILDFARTRGLRIQWGEWKINDGVFQRIQNYITGFESIVTVTFQTNSGESEPASAFLSISSMFQHWGGGIQSWYWETRDLGTELDMPAPLLVEHAVSAKNMGAEMLQFEPYWYFFDNGETTESLRLLMTMLT